MSSGIGGVGSDDQRWIEAAKQSGVVKDIETPHGKTAEQTRKDQKPTLAKGFQEAGVETSAKALAMATHGAAAVALGAISVVVTAGTHASALYHAVADAQELKEAYARDAVNLAFVWTASAALPADYVASKGYELRAVAGERGGASKILTPLMKDDTNWQALKAQSESHVRFARRFAEKSKITTPQALAQRLKTDSRFAEAYRGSMAFQHGVDSYVFECERRRIASGR